MFKKILFLFTVLLSLQISAQENKIGSNGNVGIGTTTPNANTLLHITSTTSGDAVLLLEADTDNNNESDNPTIQLRQDGNSVGLDIGISSSNIINFRTKYNSTLTDALNIRADNGNVGIGTTTPTAKLDVKGKIRIQGANSTDNNSPGIVLVTADDFLYDGEYLNHYGIGFHKNDDGASQLGSNLYLSGYFGVDIFAGGKNRFRVTQHGKVGIGTTIPNAYLDIGYNINSKKLGVIFGHLHEGNTSGDGTFLGVRGYGTQLRDYNGKSFAIEHNFYGVKNSSISFYRGGSTHGGFITFSTDENIERLRISTNGNVGIGTSTPNAKLTVAGNIHSREVKVTVDAGADYVFEEEYKLKELSELEAYLKENKHLPEVQSASEMETDGIELAKMNILLLKKIEELTLYVISIEKDNKRQEDKIP